MDLKDFVHQSPADLMLAYNRLLKAVVPVFSGAVDTLINKIDGKKVGDTTFDSLAVVMG